MRPRFSTLPAALARAASLVWQSAPRLVLANLLLTPIQALLPLASLYLLKRLVDAAAVALAATERLPALRGVAGLLLAAAAVMVLGILTRASLAWLGQALAFAVDTRVRTLLHARLLQLDIDFFENPRGLDRLYLARDQALQRPMSMVNGLLQLVQSVTNAVGLLILLGAFQWWLPCGLVLGALPTVALRLNRSRKIYDWRLRMTPVEREASYFDRLLAGGTQAKELRVYQHGGYFCRRFEQVRAQVWDARLLLRRHLLAGDVATQLLGLAVVALMLAILARDVFSGLATLGTLVMYVQAVQRGHGALSGTVGGLTGLYEDALFLQGFEELMAYPVRIRAPASPAPAPRRVRQGIVFEGVSFAYPGSARPALDNVSFTLQPGTCVTLVGGNGSGKSTLVKLLGRLYDPTSGRILVDGVDLRDFDPEAWRARLGVLFQDFGAYQLSVRENIWIGDARQEARAPEIVAAAVRAGAAPLIERLPQGYETRLGRAFQEGVELSIGQWQRVALARAFARDSALFVLDEPTSALDGQALRETLEAIERWRQDRMVLLVTHGPAAVRIGGRVIVLREGRVVEQGDPAELARAGGEFGRLFDAGGDCK